MREVDTTRILNFYKFTIRQTYVQNIFQVQRVKKVVNKYFILFFLSNGVLLLILQYTKSHLPFITDFKIIYKKDKNF